MNKTAAQRIPDLWSAAPAGGSDTSGLESILPSVTRLPIRFWRPHFFFTGAEDTHLQELTNGRFPQSTLRGKSHPVYSLKQLPDQVGAVVCPCTSKRPYRRGSHRYIRKGCRLGYTGHVMDRDSFLVEVLRFNIPPSVARDLRFRGEVPATCVETWKP